MKYVYIRLRARQGGALSLDNLREIKIILDHLSEKYAFTIDTYNTVGKCIHGIIVISAMGVVAEVLAALINTSNTLWEEEVFVYQVSTHKTLKRIRQYIKHTPNNWLT